METIIVNNLHWLTSNLNKTTFNDGTKISYAASKVALDNYTAARTPCYHWHHFKEDNAHLGCCYNYIAVSKINDIVSEEY